MHHKLIGFSLLGLRSSRPIKQVYDGDLVARRGSL